MRIFYYSLLALLASAAPAGAQTYDVVIPLSFGTFAITANDAPYDLTVSETGAVSNDAPFAVGSTGPVRGEMDLEALPGNTDINVSFDPGTLEPDDGPGPAFTVTDFTITTDQPPANQFRTTPAGHITLYYGATLRSSGDGQSYISGDYSGDFDITIDY